MTSRPKTSEAKTLEQYRVTFENAALQPQIATTLAEYGYDAPTMAEGKVLYNLTRKAYDSNKAETDEATEAYANFASLKEQLEDLYGAHRKKAKVVFKNDAITANKLGVTSSVPEVYVNWIETVRKFYSVAIAEPEIQTKLSRLKITLSDLNETQALIPQVEALRVAYLKEKGESQDATTLKDNAFSKLDTWMSEFYAVAKIAMEDHPQLLEALGLIVKN